mgnify:CR=1 FL=1
MYSFLFVLRDCEIELYIKLGLYTGVFDGL